MSLRPDFSHHRQDQRFDRYRDRVGRLFREDKEVGLILVRVEAYTEQVGGFLWWRRWKPSWDALWLWLIVDEQFSDTWMTDGLDDELGAFDEGRFSYCGEMLAVRWTDEEESAALRASAFG
jgi:hypothetical protein